MLDWRGQRRRKRKESFGFQMCYTGAVLGLVAGLQAVVQRAGERHLKDTRQSNSASVSQSVCLSNYNNINN